MSPDREQQRNAAGETLKMKPGSLALVICSLVALLVALRGSAMLWKEAEEEPGHALNPSESAASRASSVAAQEQPTRSHLDSPREEGDVSAPHSGQAGPTFTRAEDFLATHWGARWSIVRQQLLERGVTLEQLDAEVDTSTIPTWEEVQEDIQESVLSGVAPGALGSKSPEEVSAGRYLNAYGGEMDEAGARALAERVGVTELGKEELAMSLEIIESFEQDYREAAERAARAEAEVRHRIWDSGEYASGPLFAAGGPDSIFAPHQGVSSTVIHKGWNVQYFIDPSSSPQLARAMDDLLSIRRERERALRAYWGR